LGSDDREVGVAPQRQGHSLIKARNDLIDRPSGNPYMHEFIFKWDGTPSSIELGVQDGVVTEGNPAGLLH
jgi:hypothetical protein